MGDDETPLSAGARIELWTGCEAVGRFAYPHVAVAFNARGHVTGIAAAETVPGDYDTCFLGLFIDGKHINLGATEDWCNRSAFFHAAISELRHTIK